VNPSASDNETPLLPLILVVDDQPSFIQTLYQLLDDDYDIAMATSGSEALAYCEKKLPDLILLDVVMPNMDGFEVCRRLKANPATQDIPIIFVTVRSDPVDEAAGLDKGAVDYITKPLVDIVVKARIRTQLALRQAVNSLERAQADLYQAEKMLALGRIVAGVAHELNTPLGNAMVTATSLQQENHALMKGLTEGRVKRSEIETHVWATEDCLTLIMRSLFRVTNLIDTFKQVAIKDTGEVRNRFLLDELLFDIVGAMDFSQETAKVQCELAVDPGLQLESYPGALGRALIGLIQNAQVHAYRSSPGVVHITGTRIARSEDGTAASIRIVVRDQGCGIPAENLKRIFDPFHTTQIGQGGPGLGLAITWTLITQVLGGRIEVASTLGQGTQFIISLPITAPQNRS
jgi:signal transduction histidine kinase